MPVIVKALQRNQLGHLEEVPLGQPLVATIPCTPTITLDPGQCDVACITIDQDVVINITNSGYDRQKMILELTQDHVGNHSVTLGTGFQWGRDLTSYTSSGDPGKTDLIGLSHNLAAATWRVMAVSHGF